MSEEIVTNLLLQSYFYDFLQLKKKIEQDYAKTVKNIQFKDDKGDFISITSDLELLEARKLRSTEFKIIFETEVTTPEKKIFQSTSSSNVNQPISENPSSPVIHSAHCNICQKTIVGIRYKCAHCVNYDLCSLCEVKNSKGEIHYSDHIFLKIYRPVINDTHLLIPNLYTPNAERNSVSHCPYFQSVGVRLEKAEKEVDEVMKNFIQAEKERNQAEKRKEIQFRKQVKQQRRRSTNNLKLHQILNSNQFINSQEKASVSELKEDEQILPKEATPSQPELNQEENPIHQVEKIFEDFEFVPREDEEKQSLQSQSEEIQPVSQYEEQLALLASMGFLDRNLNESLLIQFKNVSHVLHQLLPEN